MREINQRIEFDNTISNPEFININLVRKEFAYKYQCLLKNDRGLFEFGAIIDSAEELNEEEGKYFIEELTVEAFDYFGLMLENKEGGN